MNAPTLPQDQPAYPALAPALRTGAQDYWQAAAIDILIGLPHRRFANEDFVKRYLNIENYGRSTARVAYVRWGTLGRDLGAGNVHLPDAERRMLLIACSLAAGTPISLSEVLVGLDVASAATLTIAVDRVVRRLR